MHEGFRAIGRLSAVFGHGADHRRVGAPSRRVVRVRCIGTVTRADKPFIALNMAAIPRDLLESELFGHERGAFTGAAGGCGAAASSRPRQARCSWTRSWGHAGPELQTRLLRVLSDGCFYRVGGHQPLRADVRVIRRDPSEPGLSASKQGLFREDLYHRAERDPAAAAAAARTPRGTSRCWRAISWRAARASGALRPSDCRPRRPNGSRSFRFPATCASSKPVAHWLTVLAPAQLVQVSDLPDELQHEGGTPIGAAPAAASSTGADAVRRGRGSPPWPMQSAASWTDLLAADVERLMHQGTEAVIDELTRDFRVDRDPAPR